MRVKLEFDNESNMRLITDFEKATIILLGRSLWALNIINQHHCQDAIMQCLQWNVIIQLSMIL